MWKKDSYIKEIYQRLDNECPYRNYGGFFVGFNFYSLYEAITENVDSDTTTITYKVECRGDQYSPPINDEITVYPNGDILINDLEFKDVTYVKYYPFPFVKNKDKFADIEFKFADEDTK